VLDNLTYAGRLENIESVKDQIIFVKGDIADAVLLKQMFAEYKITHVVNFAAETHVDRSIGNPKKFIVTDVLGTYQLLEASKTANIKCFVQISTDEVYGQVLEGHSVETDPLMPRNPYSASKAGADRLAYSYFATYGLPVIITRCSNNYGPYQYPEKLIPLFITNLLENKKVPLYGDGQNVRDWIYVEDHVRAVDFLMDKGELGEIYNIGAGEAYTNSEITQILLKALYKNDNSIEYVEDRLGHDRRYALDSSKLQAMGWKTLYPFEKTMAKTIHWYCDHKDWWEPIKSGEFKEYYRKRYLLE
jgi:dTDP-glucose 4,6-dehydratase